MPTIKKYKICKRLGAGIYEKCQTQKFTLAQAKAPFKRGKRVSDYGKQLIEKQKVRFLYGVSEKQFSNYVKKSVKNAKKGTAPAQLLFQSLENRLDNIVYRLGLAETRRMARQMVSHGHVTVNGKKTRVPSYSLKEKDEVGIREGSKKTTLFEEIQERTKRTNVPTWLAWDEKKQSGSVTGVATEPDSFLNIQSVIEYYSR